ncbi:MAG: alpha/beta hydrolase family protein [Gammaproteobacteria bacterium]|nr:alpha/beta hydrolase family protein [Gammaproteobacteria bacterium]
MGTLTDMKNFCTRRTYQRQGHNHVLMAIVVLWLWSGLAWASHDLERERAWATRLEAEIPAAQRIWLGAAAERHLALYLAATQTPIGAVILLHDAGSHPDQGAVIAPLRHQLPALGWSSMALQMPLPDTDARPANYPALLTTAYARIAAAIEYLHTQKVSIIVISGYGLGAWMATNFFVTQTKYHDDIAGLVSISIPSWPDLSPGMDTSRLLAQIKIPRLDVFAELDLPEVRRYAPDRLNSARQTSTAELTKKDTPSFSVHSLHSQVLTRRKYGADGFRQRVIPGADHFYTGQNDALFKAISGWLNAYWRSTAAEIKSPKPASADTGSIPNARQ